MLVRQIQALVGWAVIQRTADGSGKRGSGLPGTQDSAMTRWLSERPPLWLPIRMILPPHCTPQVLWVTPDLFNLTVSHPNQISCIDSA